MKTKRIRIKTKAEFYDDLLKAARQLDRGKTPKPIKGDFFESLDAVRKVLTPGRLAVWQAARDQKPGSIVELARLLGRDFKSVHRDVSMLVAFGLIVLKPVKGARGNAQRPVSLVDSILLEVA